MAEFRHGVNGAFSGKVGSVIGSNWRDIDYMRGLPKKSSKEPTAKQLGVRARFTLVSQFLLLIKDAVDRGYSKQYSGKATAFNLAVRANQEALIGTDLDPQLDYAKIIISKGLTLPKPFGCKLEEGVMGHVLVRKSYSKSHSEYTANTGQMDFIACQVTALNSRKVKTAMITALSAPGSKAAEVTSTWRHSQGKARNKISKPAMLSGSL